MVIHRVLLQDPSGLGHQGCMLTGGRPAYGSEPLGKVGLLAEQGELIREVEAKLQSPWSGLPTYLTRDESCSTGHSASAPARKTEYRVLVPVPSIVNVVILGCGFLGVGHNNNGDCADNEHCAGTRVDG